MPIVNKKRQVKIPPPEPVSNKSVRVRAARPDQPQFNPPQRGMNAPRSRADVPPQPMAHVGMNNDQMWFDHHVIGKVDGDYDSEQEMIDNNEEMDIESVDQSGLADPPENDYDFYAGERKMQVEDLSGIKSGSVGGVLPEDIDELEEDSEEPSELGITFSLDKGHYAVLLKGQLVVQSEDVKYIKSVVEDMILTHDLDVKDITVLKSIPIDFGVLFRDE
jgi:hypothetical protein